MRPTNDLRVFYFPEYVQHEYGRERGAEQPADGREIVNLARAGKKTGPKALQL
jgi:hypothetical protein